MTTEALARFASFVSLREIAPQRQLARCRAESRSCFPADSAAAGPENTAILCRRRSASRACPSWSAGRRRAPGIRVMYLPIGCCFMLRLCTRSRASARSCGQDFGLFVSGCLSSGCFVSAVSARCLSPAVSAPLLLFGFFWLSCRFLLGRVDLWACSSPLGVSAD